MRVALALVVLLLVNPASAATLRFEGPELLGASGVLRIDRDMPTGWIVTWGMDFTGYTGGDRSLLQIGFTTPEDPLIEAILPFSGTLPCPALGAYDVCAEPTSVFLHDGSYYSHTFYIGYAFDYPLGCDFETCTREIFGDWTFHGQFANGQMFSMTKSITPPIPEPSAFAVFALGFAVVGWRLRLGILRAVFG